ncbi:hypothetical protein THAOC_32342 [Thalassiosira oceanica]|uniref:Uncharacterized protein n=1 Tax=Thalassiosira oceanica TaxID=159749 RepID=K0R678_THAOC|nr:hypothetical protein THAOC_32342 [Thalassiosira oceanica]|eukprot:EJK48828.1 hypothetical protein THAOC_32342 [Thalassiosira oceanica]
MLFANSVREIRNVHYSQRVHHCEHSSVCGGISKSRKLNETKVEKAPGAAEGELEQAGFSRIKTENADHSTHWHLPGLESRLATHRGRNGGCPRPHTVSSGPRERIRRCDIGNLPARGNSHCWVISAGERKIRPRLLRSAMISSLSNNGVDAPLSSSTSTPQRSSPWQLRQRCRPAVHFSPTCPGSLRTSEAYFALHSWLLLFVYVQLCGWLCLEPTVTWVVFKAERKSDLLSWPRCSYFASCLVCGLALLLCSL